VVEFGTAHVSVREQTGRRTGPIVHLFLDNMNVSTFRTLNIVYRVSESLHRIIACDYPCKLYAHQTKIWEGGTKDEIRIFEALFKGVSTRCWIRTIEKTVENPDFIFCSSFPNLRLGGINLLQKTMAHPRKPNTSHRSMILSFVSSCKLYGLQTSRRQLIRIFDKPAFSRFFPKR